MSSFMKVKSKWDSHIVKALNFLELDKIKIKVMFDIHHRITARYILFCADFFGTRQCGYCID